MSAWSVRLAMFVAVLVLPLAPTAVAATHAGFASTFHRSEVATFSCDASSRNTERARPVPIGDLFWLPPIGRQADLRRYDPPAASTTSQGFVATKPGSGPQLFDNLAPGDVARAGGFQAIQNSKLGNLTGKFNYVVLEDGTLVVAKRTYGHIDLANGGRVQAAGEVHIVNGEVRAINNASGHYKPSGSSAQAAAEGAFNSSGVKVRPGAYGETR